MGIGYNLATKKIPCIYMQNSGLGNAINPLISIAHKKVYSIPMLLMIGWRGSPGIKDEPQHQIKGKITLKLLKLLNIKFCILENEKDFKKLKKLINYCKKKSEPVAFLIKRNVLKTDNKKTKITEYKKRDLQRKDFIEKLLGLIKNETKLIATTGFTSRELHQIRKNNKISKGKDFYMIGGMGHSSMVSLGISMRSKKEIICLDGDGSLLMHLGSIVSIGKIKKGNFKHVLFNNFSHESVGGQTTNIDKVNLKKLVTAVGYKNYYKIDKVKELQRAIKTFLKNTGPSFLEVKISTGSMKNLKRPKDFLKIKKNFQSSF